MPHLSSTHKIAILTVLVLIGVAAILVPLITIGKFGMSHTNDKKDAIKSLKHAQTELSDLKHKLSELLNQTTLAVTQATQPAQVNVRRKRQAPVETQPAAAQPQVAGAPAVVPATTSAAAAGTVGVSATVAAQAATPAQAGVETNSAGQNIITKTSVSAGAPAGLVSTNPINATLSASVPMMTSSLPTVNSNSTNIDTTSVTEQTTRVVTKNDTKESAMNETKVNDVFNTVFDILDKMSAAEKIFASGDYSSAGNMEELVQRLHQSSESFGGNLLKSKEDTANLVSYLLSKVETEEKKLNKAISQLEVTEVI